MVTPRVASDGELVLDRAVRAAVATDGEAAPDPPARPIARGRILVAGDGQLLGTESGTVRIRACVNERSMPHRVEVVDGEFELVQSEFLEGEIDRLVLMSGELGGRPVEASTTEITKTEITEKELLGDDDDGWLLIATWIEGRTLRAVAAEDGRDLLDVELFEPNPPEGWLETGVALHPGSGAREPRRIQGPQDSPLELEPTLAAIDLGRSEVVVGAPGRVWKTASVPVGGDTAEEARVELERAGALVVVVTAIPPDAGLLLRVKRQDEAVEVFYQQSLEQDLELVLEGVPAGEWTVSAERGEDPFGARSFGESVATVVVGETARVELEVEPAAAERVEHHAVSIDVELAAGWAVDRAEWVLKRLDSDDGEGYEEEGRCEFEELEGGALRPSEPIRLELPAGEYGFYLRDLAALSLLRVERDGPLLVAIEAPLAFTVEVSAAWSDEPLSWMHVSMHPHEVLRLGSWSSADLEREGETALFHGRSAPGRIGLIGLGDGAAHTRATFDLRGDGDHFRLQLIRGTKVRMLLLDGERPIDFPRGWSSPRVERFDGTAVSVGSRRSNGERSLVFTESGVFMLEAPEIDGYVAPPPVEHTVVEGQDSTVEFRYRRKF